MARKHKTSTGFWCQACTATETARAAAALAADAAAAGTSTQGAAAAVGRSGCSQHAQEGQKETAAEELI